MKRRFCMAGSALLNLRRTNPRLPSFVTLIKWPPATRLLFVGKNSDRLGAPDEVLLAQSLLPGQEMDVSVPLVAPVAPGRYMAYFRLASADGKKFGQRVWVMISVAGQQHSSSDEENEPGMPPADVLAKWRSQLDVLAQLGFVNVPLNVRLLRKHGGSLEEVAAVLLRRRAVVFKKKAAAAAAMPAAALVPIPVPAAAPLPPLASAALTRADHPSEKVE